MVGVLVAVALSYLLAATATATLDARWARVVIRARVAGLLAYVAWMAIAGIGRTAPLVLGESVTMATIVGLWCYGRYAGRPEAGRVLVAMAVLALSAVFFVLPAGIFPASVGLDARAAAPGPDPRRAAAGLDRRGRRAVRDGQARRPTSIPRR